MNTKNINEKFEAMGARVKIGALAPRTAWGARDSRLFTLDVQGDGDGEFFELRVRSDFEGDFTTLDVQPGDRHLLLMVKGFEPQDGRRPLPFTEKFLCGHDERHWFVAATKGGSTVVEAKEALKPALVRQVQSNVQLKAKDCNSRKNAAFVRQGEWFFIPCPDLVVDDRLVLKNEPLRRGRGKPHSVQFLYRRGGTTVHVCNQYPSGLTESEFKTLIHNHPEKKNLPWQTMKRDPEAFAKGKVRHSDHKTIRLPCWHRIVMNTEAQSRGAARVAFLD